MSQVKRDNHFVPRGYLKRWADDQGRVWVYRLLVSHESVPEWEPKPIQGVAFRRDLYTTVVGGREVDEFEQWIASQFETPGLAAVEKATTGAVLTSADHEALALYFAAQDLRTPQSYLESRLRWERDLPGIIDNTLKDVLEILEGRRPPDQRKGGSNSTSLDLGSALTITVDPDAIPERNQGTIGVEVTAGRTLWLAQQRHLLEGAAKMLTQHSWGIAEAAAGYEWFTSDHPAVKLNYAGHDTYDFGGGWGRFKGNLLLPLSPRHLLFAQIGETVPGRFSLSGKQTRQLQRFIAERAHRIIVSRARTSVVRRLRPRQVDAAAERLEQAEWTRWHERQVNAEGGGETGPTVST